jgi:hypothetical protein
VILRLLNWQGIAGIGLSLALAILLLVQKADTRHWKKQSASFEQLYRQDQAAYATTVADYRAAAEQAHAADRANAARAAAEQGAINERIEHDYQVRLAAARAAAADLSSGRVRHSSEAAADTGPGRSPSMPGLPAAAARAPEGASKDQLPASDALTATEQAIQLDELIKWVRAQAAVDNNPKAVASHPDD